MLLYTSVALLPCQAIGAGALASAVIAGTSLTLAFQAAICTQPPVARAALLATRATDARTAMTLAILGMAIGAHRPNVTVAPLAAQARFIAIMPFLTAITVLTCHSRLTATLASFRITRVCPTGQTAALGAVLCHHRIAVKPRGAHFASRPCGVVHAPCADAGQCVAVAEEHVGVSIATTVTGLAGAANHERISIVTWRAPFARNSGITQLAETLRARAFVDAAGGEVVRRN